MSRVRTTSQSRIPLATCITPLFPLPTILNSSPLPLFSLSPLHIPPYLPLPSSPPVITMESPYDILGIPPTTSLKLIKKAYKAQALLCHPDKTKSDASNEAFHRLRAAYELLLSEENRTKYTQQIVNRQGISADVRRFREELLTKEAKYRVEKAAKKNAESYSIPKKRRKSEEKEEGRREASVLEQGNVLFVQWSGTNLVYTQSMLVDIFTPFGPVLEVVLNPEKSGAYVLYASSDSAVRGEQDSCETR